MLSRWQWLFIQFGRRLWVRVTLFSLAAFGTALLAALIGPFIHTSVPGKVGADALDNILGILASSMLAVTTFSLTTMVTAYTAVTSSATPRSSRLLMDDPTTQNTLGTFIGSFIFSLVGIIMLTTGAYGENGRLVLFAVTLCVIFLIVVTMLRWIDYLSRVGRVGEVAEKVELEASRALRDRMQRPYLGGRRLHDIDRDVPAAAQPVRVTHIGHVQHIDIRALETCAGEIDGAVHVLVLPGSFVDPNRPLAKVTGGADEAMLERLAGCFTVDDDRSFDQDPRFGLCVLAEVASRALSPGINDPGTAIDVIGRGVRVLADWAPRDEPGHGDDARKPDVECPRVLVPALRSDDLFDDFFGPIGRDGAGLVEIQVKLQKALLSLAALGDAEMEESAARHSRLALARAETALVLEVERQQVRDLAAAFGAAPETAS
jgi:uncharacterized membrane protein